jgi:serine/threonine-protein kinase
MEYVEGYDLNALLRRCSQTKTPLPMEFALRIVCDALAGLDYAHRAKGEDGRPLGLVHRDVSPSNILISLEGEVKLCDFGIAHANEVALRDGRAPRVGVQVDEAIKGKAGYMSPEHARGEAIDARADVFAAGIVLWELLSGRRLYRLEGMRPPLLEQARRAEIPPIPERGLPDEAGLHAIAIRALARERDARYPSAAAMLRDLEEYVVRAKLSASPLKLGEWVVDRFGVATIQQRRLREQTVSDLPPVEPMPAADGDDLEPPPSSSSELPGFPPSAVVRGPSTAPEEKAPSSVALGTIDLGPPSVPILPVIPLPSSGAKAATIVVPEVKAPSKRLVLAVILLIVFGLPAAVATLLAMR